MKDEPCICKRNSCPACLGHDWTGRLGDRIVCRQCCFAFGGPASKRPCKRPKLSLRAEP